MREVSIIITFFSLTVFLGCGGTSDEKKVPDAKPVLEAFRLAPKLRTEDQRNAILDFVQLNEADQDASLTKCVQMCLKDEALYMLVLPNSSWGALERTEDKELKKMVTTVVAALKKSLAKSASYIRRDAQDARLFAARETANISPIS